ncbi:MAG: hypothetical protein GY863_14715 [bacterium]|nr:hypothetical protein [bacterium]
MSTVSWVYCFNCFKKIDREDAVKDGNVYFCDWDCRDAFFEKIEKKKKSEEEEEEG